MKASAFGNSIALEELSFAISIEKKRIPPLELENIPDDIDSIINFNTDIIQDNALTYICGHIIRKLDTYIYKCRDCTEIMYHQNNSEHPYHSLDDTYILLSTKQNGGLVVPSKLLVSIVKIGFNVLRNFSQSKTNKKILLLKSMSIINDNIIDII